MTSSHRFLLAACCLFLGVAACSGGDPKGGDGAADGNTVVPPDDGGGGNGDQDGGTDGGTEPACNPNPCGEHSTCSVDSQNQPVCGCETNFVRIDGKCELGRCAVENGGCDVDHGICTAAADNTSRTCSCKVGYIGDGITCVKDPCFENADCDANATCGRRNSNTEHICVCNDGYVGDGFSCMVDRCIESCGGHATCSNDRTKDRCTCDENYHMNGTDCVANTPCDDPSTFSCKANATCHNKPDGTYDCVCDLGYEGNGKVECTVYHACEHTSCPAHSTCNERNFQAFCDCDPNWQENAAGDACEDIDECANMTATCGAAFDCVNKVEGYTCVCKPGTIGSPAVGCRAGATTPPAAGVDHVCSVSTDHTLWCWGRNDYGQLGQPRTLVNSTVPLQVGTDTDWVSVTAGLSHNCALKMNGSLWCWGDNAYGQIGNGDASVPGVHAAAPVIVPTRVDGAWGDVVEVSAGAEFNCAIREDSTTSARTLWCWGNNDSKQLGRSSTSGGAGAFFLPGQVGTDTDWASVETGSTHGCALKATGAAYCWGTNTYGQLGTGDTTDRVAPTLVGDPVGATMSLAWTSLTTYGVFTCGLAGGGAYCWGVNDWGQLGNVLNGNEVLPIPVNAWTDWTALAAGMRHTCGVRAGQLWCWGYDILGQAGKCPPTPRVLPPQQVGTVNTWLAVSGGDAQTCGTQSDASLWCWGDNDWGQLGYGGLPNSCSPIATR